MLIVVVVVFKISPRHLGTIQRPTRGPLDALKESAVRWSVFGTAASPGLVGIVASAVVVDELAGNSGGFLVPIDDLGCMSTCIVLFLEKKSTQLG